MRGGFPPRIIHRMKKFVKIIITLFIGALVAWLVAFHQGFSSSAPLFMNFRHLSDGAFVAGMVLCGLGGLMLISTTGFFDIFAYACHSFLVLFTALKRPKDQISFVDYKTMKAEKRSKPMWFVLLCGLVFIVLSFIFLALYYHAA